MAPSRTDGPRFRVLGPLTVTGDDGAPLPLGGRRTRELLAVLVLHPSQVLSTERLVDHLWGESAGDGAATTLRTYVGQVRRVLAAAGAAEALRTRDGGYELAIDPADVDADVFDRLVQRGQESLALGDAEQARVSLSSALELWRGDVLADLAAPPYAQAVTARLEERRADAWEALVDSELALGRHRDVVTLLQRLTAEHPFRERFTAQLVLALYRCGRQADALAAYAAMKQRLGEELGLDPGPELRDLEQAVLRQDPGLAGAPQPRPPSSARAPAPLPDAVLAALGRLPMAGRRPELDRLLRAWRTARDGGAAVCLVSGAAGIGKSRLVAELARQAADEGAAVLVGRCEDGAPAYAPLLQAVQASPALPQALAGLPTSLRALLEQLVLGPGAPASGTPPAASEGEGRRALERALVGLLRGLADGTPLLLVVDDAHLLDGDSAVLLRHLAVHLPDAVLLAVCFRDPPGSAHAPLAVLLGDAAVVEVAERVVPEVLTEDELGELVAAVSGAPPDPSFVARLHDHTGGNPFFAREVVRAVGTGRGPAASGWATVPVGVRDVLRQRLAGLPDVTREALAAASVLGVEVELVRLSRLLAWAEEDVSQALAPAVLAGFLVEAGQSWAGAFAFPHELMREAVHGEVPPQRRARLHLEAATAVVSGPDVSDLDRVAAAVHLRRAVPVADPVVAALASLDAAAIARRRWAWDEAVVHAEAALRLLDGTGAETERVRASVEVAMLRLRTGRDYPRAVRLLEQALTTTLAAGDLAAAGVLHSRLGGALCLHHSVMDVPRALEHFASAERLLPDAARVFHVHRGRAQAAMHALRTDVLLDASRQAEHVAAALGRRDLAVFGLWGRAWHAVDHGRTAAASELLEQGWAIARDLSDPYLAWMPVNAAALFATEFRLDPAAGRAWCRRGLGTPRFDAFAQPHGAVVDQLALALLAMGEVAAARDVVAGLPADALARRVLRFRDGEWEEAAQAWAAAVGHDEQGGDRLDALVNGRWLAEALLALGDDERAQGVLERGLELALSGPQVPSELWIRAELARLAARSAPSDALAHLQRCEQLLSHR